MKARVAWCAAVLAGGVLAGQAVAQAPSGPPTVTITASPTAVSVGATGAIPAGPTRLDMVRAAGAPDTDVFVALLVPGVTIDQLTRTLAVEDRTGGESSLGLVSLQASAAIVGRETHRATTLTLKPGLTYVVVAEPDAEANGKAKQRSVTTFSTSGAANGATAPAPAATVRMQGLRFRGPSTLPRRGTVNFENRDGVAHFALAFPLRKGTTRQRLGRSLRSGESAIGRIVAGPPYMAQNVLSGGDTGNAQELSFPAKGRYGLVCFINGHDRLGMYRVITVK
jgi:plastocyanin